MKNCFVALLWLLYIVPVLAVPISEQDAHVLATRFFKEHRTVETMRIKSESEKNLLLVLTKERPGFFTRSQGRDKGESGKRNYYYVYNRGNNDGFVIISGDDRLPAVLGYSFTGTFAVGDMPDGVSAFLASIESAVEDPSKLLEDVSVDEEMPRRVAPLLGDIAWDQGYPYNTMTPNNYLVGCVATALAQVMRHYRWPDHSVENKTWGGMYVDYDTDGAYNYDLMPETPGVVSPITGEETKELSKFCYHVGVAVNMNYGPNGSGAYMYEIPYAMTNYFKYDRGLRYLQAFNMDKRIFEYLVRQSIADKMPVVFSGSPRQGSGHAFVVDGYDDSDFYHVNWGWGGLNNGYYYMAKFLQYTFYQDAIVGLRPDYTGTSVSGSVSLVSESMEFNLSSDGTFSDISIMVGVYRGGTEERSVEAKFGLAAVPLQGGEVWYSDFACTKENQYSTTISHRFYPENGLITGRYFDGLADGDYRIQVYMETSDGEKSLLPLGGELQSSIKVTVGGEGTKWALFQESPSDISMIAGKVGYWLNNKDVGYLSFELENSGSSEWQDSYAINYDYCSLEGSILSDEMLSSPRVIVNGNSRRRFNLSFNDYWQRTFSGGTIKMKLILYDGNKTKSYDLTSGYIDVCGRTTHNLSFSVIGKGEVVPRGVSNLAAVPYLTSVPFDVSPAGGWALKEVKVNGNKVPSDEPVVIYGDTDVEVVFEEVSSVEPIQSSENGEEIYYDIFGRRVINPERGLYITRSGKKVWIN